MKKQLLLMSVILFFILSGCKKESALQQSDFFPDADSPGLPLYSEWGYNTFGAYYERDEFISNDDFVPLKVIVTNDTTSFIFQGQKGASSYNSEMHIKFRFPDFLPNDYSELILLNDSTFDLENINYKVLVTMEDSTYNATILNGKLQFKRAQKLLVDNQPTEVILSGYFEFQAIINNLPISVTDGRFDVGVGTNNFFKY